MAVAGGQGQGDAGEGRRAGTAPSTCSSSGSSMGRYSGSGIARRGRGRTVKAVALEDPGPRAGTAGGPWRRAPAGNPCRRRPRPGRGSAREGLSGISAATSMRSLAAASVAKTMPAEQAPRSTKTRAPRTSGAGASRGSEPRPPAEPDQRLPRVHPPPGRGRGRRGPACRRSCPGNRTPRRSRRRGRTPAGATTTSRLASRSTRVAVSMRPRLFEENPSRRCWPTGTGRQERRRRSGAPARRKRRTRGWLRVSPAAPRRLRWPLPSGSPRRRR